MKNLTIVLLILALPLAFYVGKTQSRAASPSSRTDVDRGSQQRQSTQFEFTNPLLDCEIAQENDFTELTSFRSEIEAITQKQISSGLVNHAAVYFRDLNNGPWFGINATEEFSPASLLKLPLAMSIYQEAEANPGLLTSSVQTKGQLTRDQSQLIPPLSTIKPNQQYTVNDLVRYMLQYSDNNAAELLLRLISNDRYLQPYKDLGLNLPISSASQPYTIRVRDYASFFRVLYNGSYLSRSASNTMLSTLAGSAFIDGIQAGLPSDIRVAHKFGERVFESSSERQLHDCGIVYYPKRPYLVCVMTRGADYKQMSQAIKEISQAIYTSINRQLSQR